MGSPINGFTSIVVGSGDYNEHHSGLVESKKHPAQINGDVNMSSLSLNSMCLGRIEICQKLTSAADAYTIKLNVGSELQRLSADVPLYDLTLTKFNKSFLTENIESIALRDSNLHLYPRDQVRDLWPKIDKYVYRLQEGGHSVENLMEDGGGANEDEEELPAANHWVLPSAEFKDLWENLVYDNNIKQDLIQYSRTALLFSDRGVNPSIINWNRLILLHGPPGTGKTSLCKAVAQKLSIIMSDRYQYGQLIEINSHSLFSRWFSESGKLVMKMFKKIEEFVSDKNALICVLIDEVESLSSCRQSMSGSEPSDAIRVVNALLTQLDMIRRHPNVLIMTTSNITGSIDVAFLDRADIRQYIGLPSASGIYQIYHSCIMELAKVGIITNVDGLVDRHTLDTCLQHEGQGTSVNHLSQGTSVNHLSQGTSVNHLSQGTSVNHLIQGTSANHLSQEAKANHVTQGMSSSLLPAASQKLFDISRQSEGLSGRSLRKLPFVSHARYLQVPHVSLMEYLTALEAGVKKHFQDANVLQEPDRKKP